MKIERTVQIVNRYGICARPSALIVKTAYHAGPDTDVRITCEGVEADAKHVMDVLRLEAGKGRYVTITASGPNAEAVVKELEEVISKRCFDIDEHSPDGRPHETATKEKIL